jgi:carbon-monoxide dehydrogenase medium subunit
MLTGLRSRKHIAPFDLVQPRSIEECCALLSGSGRLAFMAGGLDLIDRMKTGEAFDTVMSLSRVAGLSGIRRDDGAVVIGATTTHATIAQSDIVLESLPGLSQIWMQIGNPRVRLAGTIGGNLMSAQPHYDAMPALLALGADATLAGPSGRRRIPLADLTDSKELLVDIRLPGLGLSLIADRSLHPALAVYLGAELDGGIVRHVRIAIGGCYARAAVFVLPVQDMPAASVGAEGANLARDLVKGLPEPLSDGLASASYRLRMIEVLTRRLLVRLGHRS